MNSYINLSEKEILITGGSSGIGKATAILCNALGAHVIIVGRNETKLKDTIAMMGGCGSYFVADITRTEEITALVSKLPKLDGIVHCAGIGHRKMGKQITQEDIDSVFSINFNAPVLLQAALLSTKKVSSGASVVFISSRAYTSPSIGNGIYSASKGALIAYAKCLALELAPRKIRVNCVCPAMVWTDLILQGTATKEDLEQEQLKYPLKRFGYPEDVANVVAFLLSDESCWVTNSCYDVTGGGE